MENTKAKNVIITVLILILVCMAGFLGYYISKAGIIEDKANNTSSELNKEKNQIDTTNQEQVVNNENQVVEKQETTTKTETNNETKTTTNSTTTTNTTVKYKYIVETAVNKNLTGKSMCNDGTKSTLIIKAPKININTQNVKKFNNEIYKKYNNMKASGVSYDISYEYKYISGKNILLIKIIETHYTNCSSGGTDIISYVYDIKNDKFLSNKELLSLYNISKNSFKESAYYHFEKRFNFNNTEINNNKDEKIKLNSLINNYKFDVIDISDDVFTAFFEVIDLDGLVVY